MSEQKHTKRRILFLIRDLEHGGISRVLINLLERLNTNQVEADLFVCNPIGLFKTQIINCHFLPPNYLVRLLSCNYRKESGFIKLFAMILKLVRHGIKKSIGFDFVFNWANKKCASAFHNKYDVIWACSEDTPAKIAEYVHDNCCRVLWIHNNYSSEAFRILEANGLPDFLAFDKIVCVSNHAANAVRTVLFNKKSIDVGQRADIMYNIVNEEFILKSACEEPNDTRFLNDRFTIVSIGRLAWEKNTEAIPVIAAELKRMGASFFWYVIGGGSEEMLKNVMDRIRSNHVGDVVTLLGEKSNPYSYLARSNLLVLPSRFETYPTVINESKVLGIPVISTDFAGVEEILFPKDGWVCKLEDFPKCIHFAINGGITQEMKMRKHFEIHNCVIMEKFYKILDRTCNK